jgi:hypothetical protein
MLATLLLAAVLAAQAPHLAVQQAAQPIVVSRPVSPNAGETGLDVFAYCDAKGQSTIMMTNASQAALVVEWTLTAVTPGYPPDSWSSVITVGPGQFEGWMSPAPYLHLDVRYDDDGLPTTDSVDAFCPATAGLSAGFED